MTYLFNFPHGPKVKSRRLRQTSNKSGFPVFQQQVHFCVPSSGGDLAQTLAVLLWPDPGGRQEAAVLRRRNSSETSGHSECPRGTFTGLHTNTEKEGFKLWGNICDTLMDKWHILKVNGDNLGYYGIWYDCHWSHSDGAVWWVESQPTGLWCLANFPLFRQQDG